jgi:hypothetical protein
MPAFHARIYRRLTASVPLLVTVVVHIALIAVAGYFFVTEQLIEKKKKLRRSLRVRTHVCAKTGRTSSASGA